MEKMRWSESSEIYVILWTCVIRGSRSCISFRRVTAMSSFFRILVSYGTVTMSFIAMGDSTL